MGLNDTPSGERIHIGFFGRRNAGKSSVVNAVTGQELAVVSDTRGTTTDPVSKAMELLPMGPVLIIDTPGFDDEGALGEEIGSAISTKRTFGEGSHVGRVQNIAQPLSMLLYWKYIIILPIGISAVTSTTAIVTPKK